LLCLALCHTAFSEEKGSEIIYQASSPDEMALISAARYYKYIFLKREIGNKMVIEIKGKRFEYEVSHILEYTSERKRMSVIVRCPDGKIRLYAKGADSVIKERIGINREQIDVTDGHLHQFAKKGLRTLAIAYRELSKEEFNKFEDEYNKAIDHYDKETLMPKVFEIVENNYYLLGATAIDDKLQDHVGACLESFIKTGIKVWVLTGDKVDTAKSIAFSCKLLTHEFVILEFPENSTHEELKILLDEYIRKINSKEKANKKFCLVVASNEIAKMMESRKLTNKVISIELTF
jgi:phospholipid-transporting ATPase